MGQAWRTSTIQSLDRAPDPGQPPRGGRAAQEESELPVQGGRERAEGEPGRTRQTLRIRRSSRSRTECCLPRQRRYFPENSNTHRTRTNATIAGLLAVTPTSYRPLPESPPSDQRVDSDTWLTTALFATGELESLESVRVCSVRPSRWSSQRAGLARRVTPPPITSVGVRCNPSPCE